MNHHSPTAVTHGPAALDPLDPTGAARLALLRHLADLGYRFVTPSPASHRRILLRRGRRSARDLADVFGWNLPFHPALVGEALIALMREARMLAAHAGRFTSTLRVASLEDLLFLHSPFPAKGPDAVFFGPDTYRFAAFINRRMPRLAPGAAILDIGTGAGAGGLFAGQRAQRARVTLSDVNPAALELAAVNAAFAGGDTALVLAEGATGAASPVDLIVANPPYVAGASLPTYSRGGGALGEGLTVQWATEAAARLAPGGRLLLYTGSPIIGGEDLLRDVLARAMATAGCAFAYEELDPDVFPELLRRPAYWRAERIAAVGMVADRPKPPPPSERLAGPGR